MTALIRRSTRPVAGIGTIVALIRTDDGTPERPFVRFVLRVDVDGLDQYDATGETEVPEALLRLLRPGARFAVRVDPSDPDAPEVDLSRLWVSPATQVIG